MRRKLTLAEKRQLKNLKNLLVHFKDRVPNIFIDTAKDFNTVLRRVDEMLDYDLIESA